MKSEVSAGGIIVRKRTGGWEVLILYDRKNKATFPKGLVEKGENFETAARREIAEEAGLSELSLVAKLPAIEYMYRRDGLIAKTVHYFLFMLTKQQKPAPQASEGLHDAEWVPIPRALAIIGYAKTNKPLLLWTLKKLTTLRG